MTSRIAGKALARRWRPRSWRREAACGCAVIAAVACGRETTAPRADRAVSVVVGAEHACALTGRGAAFCWGNPISGQLGFMPPRWDGVPTALPVTSSFGFGALTAGAYHTCGLTGGGQAYCWGWNAAGQLGVGDTLSRFTPTLVLGGLTFSSISAGYVRTCALTMAGAAYCWGEQTGALTATGYPATALQPVPVAGGIVFQSIDVGGLQTCGLTATGQAYCWGENYGYQLGVGDTVPRWVPTRVGGGLLFRAIASGADDVCALTLEGAAVCWGMNTFHVPVSVRGGLVFTSLRQSGDGACAVTGNGIGYCWLGIPTAAPAPGPAKIAGELRWQTVTGGGHSCGISTDGDVYCWGPGTHGELGNGFFGSGVASAVPARVLGLP